MPSNPNRPDYPALYDSANNASLTSQKYYLLGMKWYIGLSIAAAFLSIYIKESTLAGILASIMFFAILFLTIFQAVKRYDRTWYNGRAVAESVKTRTWRFIPRAEPYIDNESVNNVREEFCNDLNDILDQNRELGSFLSHESVTKDTITQSMLEIRKFSLTDRLNYYISNRINEQRNWYHTKASYNKELAKNWLIGLIVTNSIIIILLLIEVGYGFYNLPTPALIVVGSSIVSWTQIKKYQDLATSYGLTAHEIGIIKDQSFKVQGEKELSDFVKDAENAFSREHTQWVARKDKP
jgi:hypothetical protein